MSLKPRHLLWVAGWGLAVYGVLVFGSLDLDLGHALCGPWGCAPPLQALLAMHAFWLLVLLPPTASALALLSARHLRVFGKWVLGLGLLGIGIVVGRDLLFWLPVIPPEMHQYVLHRLVFVLVTMTDVPLAQIALAGAVCWMIGKQRSAEANPPSPTVLESAEAHRLIGGINQTNSG